MTTTSQALRELLEIGGVAFVLLGVTMIVVWLGIVIFNVVMKLWWNR